MIHQTQKALKIGKTSTFGILKAFDTFLWIFWLGLTIPLIEVIWTNRRNYAPDHVHRFSVVYGLTTDDILLVRTLYLFISTVLTGHASELLFLYSVRMSNVIFFYSLTYPHSYPYFSLSLSFTYVLSLPHKKSSDRTLSATSINYRLQTSEN